MNRQSGFTLIELMIAGFIGVFILTGLMNLFITTNKSVTLSGSLSQNQETGRFAMDYMTKFIRTAGYTEDFTQTTYPIFIANSAVVNPITCSGNQALACSENNPAGIRGDRLSIPFVVGDMNNDIMRTCTGTLVGGPVNGQQNLVNVFWVSDDADTIRELRCRTFDRTNNDWLDNPVSIINNVERFEFQIGVASSEEDKYASRYINLDTLEADPNTTLNHVRSIRIAILTTSQDSDDVNKTQSTIKERKYVLLDAPEFSFEDSNLRNIFINTVELPNMIEPAAL